jgi:hypothetical protein
MGLGGSRFKIQKADGNNSSAFLCGLISVEFIDQEYLNE